MKSHRSPAAQAVWEAWLDASDGHYDGGEWVPHHSDALAAAFTAAALYLDHDAQQLLAIAAELRGLSTRQED